MSLPPAEIEAKEEEVLLIADTCLSLTFSITTMSDVWFCIFDMVF